MPDMKIIALLDNDAGPQEIADQLGGTQNIAELALHLPEPEYDPKNSGLNAAMVCLSGDLDLGAVLQKLKNSGAQVISEVSERRYWDFERSWPDMDPSPGVSRITFAVKKKGLSVKKFSKHWEAHSKIAREHHPTLWRYTQNIVTQNYLNLSDLSFDGVAELHFRSYVDMTEKMYLNSESQKIVFADVEQFMDIKAGNRIFATQYILK